MSVPISHKQDKRNISAVMKIMSPPVYQHNGLVSSQALAHMMYGLAVIIFGN